MVNQCSTTDCLTTSSKNVPEMWKWSAQPMKEFEDFIKEEDIQAKVKQFQAILTFLQPQTKSHSFHKNIPFLRKNKMAPKSLPTLLAAALALAPAGLAAPTTTPNPSYLSKRALRTGMGTRYCPDGNEQDCWQDGACAFVDYTLPASLDGSTCVSEEIWEGSAQCGKCISVTYQGKTLKIMVSSGNHPLSAGRGGGCLVWLIDD